MRPGYNLFAGAVVGPPAVVVVNSLSKLLTLFPAPENCWLVLSILSFALLAA